MKKILILLFTAITMVCLSCSNNDEKITDSESITMTQSLSERDIQNLKQLNRDIQSYNRN
jgi:RNA processing factor Prp31